MARQVKPTNALPQRHRKAVTVPEVHPTNAHHSGKAVLSARKAQLWKVRKKAPLFLQKG